MTPVKFVILNCGVVSCVLIYSYLGLKCTTHSYVIMSTVLCVMIYSYLDFIGTTQVFVPVWVMSFNQVAMFGYMYLLRSPQYQGLHTYVKTVHWTTTVKSVLLNCKSQLSSLSFKLQSGLVCLDRQFSYYDTSLVLVNQFCSFICHNYNVYCHFQLAPGVIICLQCPYQYHSGLRTHVNTVH